MSEKKSVEFELPIEEDKPRRNLAPSKGSSFFSKLSQSFRRSNGDGGADVETLRGSHGADYECHVNILRGALGYSCGCFGQNDTSKERFLLIKGAFCFVFKNENSSSPMYVIGLAHLKARKLEPKTVVLQTTLGDPEYTLFFPTADRAEEFAIVANKKASLGKMEEIRVRLGHEHLLKQSKSVAFARKVARTKVNAEPEKKDPVTPDELANMNQMLAF